RRSRAIVAAAGDGDERAAAGGGGRARGHLAVPLEERPLLDDQSGGDQRRLYPGAREQLDALAALDAPADRAPDGDPPALDLGVHLAGLAHDERVLRHHAAPQLAVDAERVLEPQLTVELGARIHEAVEVLAGQALDLDHLAPLPCAAPRGTKRRYHAG